MRVLIVDDHKLFAEAIRSVLTSSGMEVLGVVTNGKDAMDAASRERPDLVLVDLLLPDASGVDVGRAILEASPQTRVLAVTALNDAEPLADALKAGFHGYLTKDTPMIRFVESIQAAMNGRVVMPHRVGPVSGTRSDEERDALLLAEQLTRREREVLAMLVEGAAGDEIASRLAISPNTVRTHIQNILTKLQVHSRLQAAAYAVRHDLVSGARGRLPA